MQLLPNDFRDVKYARLLINMLYEHYFIKFIYKIDYVSRIEEIGQDN